MATASQTRAEPETLADLLHHLGDIPPERIRFRPYPGTATVKDVAKALDAADKRLYELVDGVLVEKDMGFRESYYAARILSRIARYLDKNDLGLVVGADAAMEIMLELVRIPDVSFISWDKIPNHEIPEEPVPELVPDLAVEVISRGNTKGEMERKLRDYFEAGVRLVWFVYPKTKTVDLYVSSTELRRLSKNQSVDGGDVLPGFKLSLKTLFAARRRS